MKLGNYTFEWNPDDFTPPDADMFKSIQRTWKTAVYFSWGAEILGKPIELSWIWMSEAQWDELDAIYQAKDQMVWDPEVAGVGPFNVEVRDLDGRLFEVAGYEQPYRRDVKMTLVIADSLFAGSMS